MMEQLLSNPLLQSSLIPLVISFLSVGFLRLAVGRANGPWLANGGIVIGFLVSYLLILGLPAFPPVGATQKIFYIAFSCGLLGSLFDLDGNPKFLLAHWMVIVPVAVVWWVVAPLLPESIEDVDAKTGGQAMSMVVIGWLVFYRLRQLASTGLVVPIILISAAVCISAIAMDGGSASVAQLCAALAAALGGFALWNWPRMRFSVGAAILFGGAGSLLALSCQTIFFTKATVDALLLLLSLLFVEPLVGKIVSAGTPLAVALRPVVQLVLSFIVVTIVFSLTYLLNGRVNTGYDGW